MCVHLQKCDMVVWVYVNDAIIISKGPVSIDEFIKSLEDGPKNFDFIQEGNFESYIGVKITQLLDNKTFQLLQTFLIE